MSALQRWFERIPSSARLILGLWALRALLGWGAALPLAAAVAASGLGALPQGERALFEPGALWLVELLRVQADTLVANSRVSAVVLLVSLGALSFSSALLFVHEQAPKRNLSALYPQARAQTPRFLLLLVLEALGWGLILFVALAVAESMQRWTGRWSDPVRDLLALGVLAVGLGMACLASVLGDTMRAVSAERPGRLLHTARRGVEVFRARAGPLCGGWMLATSAGALAVALSARGVEWCDVGRAGALRVLAVAGLHQMTLLFLVVAQSLWVQRVCAAVAKTTPRRVAHRAADDRSVHSAEPAGPSSGLGA